MKNESKQAEEQKQQVAPWDFAYTPSRITHYLHKLPFLLDFTDKKSRIAFQLYSKLEQRLLLVDSRSNQVSRVESELIETKQRPFQFDESRRNQKSRIETQQSRIESRILDSWFSQGLRIECQLTFERYCIRQHFVRWSFLFRQQNDTS